MNRGFTLIELMIVVAIIAIIAAIAIPNLLESKKAANEAGAISALRTLSSAEELYNTKYASYATLTQLGPSGGSMIDGVLAAAVDVANAKGGYVYTMTPNAAAGWCCTAVPSAWGTTGERSFRCTQDGVIYYTTTGSAHGDIDGTGEGTPLGKAGG